MLQDIVIIGTSVNAKHVYSLCKDYNLYNVIGFSVDRKYISKDQLLGLPVYPLEELDQYIEKNKVKLFIALLWNRLNADRRMLFERLKSEGYAFANIISPYAHVRGIIKGENVWIHDNVIVQNDAIIEDNVSIMAMSLVGDNCIIGSHSFLGAKSTVGGGSIIGSQSFIGMNCTIFDDTVVGEKCILGACTIVKRNVPNYCLYKTTSDIVVKQYDEREIENKLIYSNNVRNVIALS